jgi:adenylosuccinate synthase
VADVAQELAGLAAGKENILCEGAQGTMLDLDHGTYPYVTSSNPVAGTVSAGAGLGPTAITDVLGIVKAYTTRVGGGPFPTELDDEVGRRLQEQGQEYGSTTGRPRRCGWLDAVVVRRAAMLSGITGLAVTKLDVLTGLERVKICTGYEDDQGRRVETVPASLERLGRCRPVYEELEGWSEDITAARRLEELPPACRAYLDRLAQVCGAPLDMVSVGPGRDQTILLRNPLG